MALERTGQLDTESCKFADMQLEVDWVIDHENNNLENTQITEK